MNLFEELTCKNYFTKSENSVADFIIENPFDIVNMSIQELGETTFTSTATVLRLCKKLGFDGFKDFKVAYLKDYYKFARVTSFVDTNTPFDERDNERNIIAKIGSLTCNSVSGTQALLDPHTIRKAVKMILKAENLFGVAVADSYIRLMDFQNKMLKINYFVKTTPLQPEQSYLCANASEKDLGLLISYSGRTAEVVHDAMILHKEKIPFIAITSDIRSPLAQLATINIIVPHDENIEKANYTLSSQLELEYALNVLFACVYQSKYSESKKHLYETRNMYLNN